MNRIVLCFLLLGLFPLCDTAHKGAFAASYPFALAAGKVPLLGDVNGI